MVDAIRGEQKKLKNLAEINRPEKKIEYTVFTFSKTEYFGSYTIFCSETEPNPNQNDVVSYKMTSFWFLYKYISNAM